jgi:hypothetical protein
MNNEIVKDFNLGGSIEQALSGNYELKPSDVIQALIFFIELKMQLGDPSVLLTLLQTPEKMDPQIVSSLLFANFSYELISAPLSAGISLMAMSHAAELRTKSRHMAKGLQYTIPIILATIFYGIGLIFVVPLSFQRHTVSQHVWHSDQNRCF